MKARSVHCRLPAPLVLLSSRPLRFVLMGLCLLLLGLGLWQAGIHGWYFVNGRPSTGTGGRIGDALICILFTLWPVSLFLELLKICRAPPPRRR